MKEIFQNHIKRKQEIDELIRQDLTSLIKKIASDLGGTVDYGMGSLTFEFGADDEIISFYELMRFLPKNTSYSIDLGDYLLNFKNNLEQYDISDCDEEDIPFLKKQNLWNERSKYILTQVWDVLMILRKEYCKNDVIEHIGIY